MTNRCIPTVFHIGYPKCGSSSLQLNLFSRSPDVRFLSSAHHKIGHGHRTGIDELTRFVGRSPEADPEQIRRQWRQAVDTDDDVRVRVISDETLTDNRVPIPEVAGRLAAMEPEASVLMVYRDRSELLRSFYDMAPVDHWASNHKAVDVLTWFDEVLGRIDEPGSLAGSLRFGSVVEALLQSFGPERIWLFEFERLFKEPAEHDRLAKLIGCRPDAVTSALSEPAVNRAADNRGRRLARRVLGPVHAHQFIPGKWRAPILRAIGRFVPARPTLLPRALTERVSRLYADDDVVLSVMRNRLAPGRTATPLN